jgi:Domain of unknown function (DUF4868)
VAARDSHDELLEFLGQAEYVNLVVASVSGEGGLDFELQRINLDDEIAGEFFDIADAAANRDRDRRLRRYEAGLKLDGTEIAFINLRAAGAGVTEEGIADLLESCCALDDLDLFTAQDDVVERMRFYVIVVQDNENCAVFVRNFRPTTNELTRSGKLALFGEAGQFDRVRQPIFLFDQIIDCYYWDDYLFIRNTTQFQRIFGYFQRLRERADAIVDAILERVPVDNADEFRRACVGQQQMMSKLAQISEKEYFDEITLDDLSQTIDDFGLEIEIVGAGADRKLVFERTPDRRWLILKLLDDDYLGSTMTDAKYEVNSKSQI